MGSVIAIVSPRQNDGLERETGPYIPYSSANGYSTVQKSHFAELARPIVAEKIESEIENLAGEEARAMGEAQIFGDGGPADEPLASSPVTEGMESVDGLTAPPSFVQSGRNQTTKLLESTDGLMYPTRRLMETSEPNIECENVDDDPLVVTELNAVEEPLSTDSNVSEATIPVVPALSLIHI